MNLNIDYITGLLKDEKVTHGLYIIATPIGNLADITIRSLKILSSVDLIICEDTRISKKLTSKYGIKKPLKPFHKFNSNRSIPFLIKKLLSGESIALISDSGTPSISDPGVDLVKSCNLNNISIFSLPGPSATVSSLILSNSFMNSFTFRGFFPRKKKDREYEISLIEKSDCPVIYFESPKRVLDTLQLLYHNLLDCNITFVRELTKKNEEVINSKINELITILKEREKVLGEITLIIGPLFKKNKNKISTKDLLLIAQKLSKEGINTSEISKIVSDDFNISKREIYQLLIKNKY